MPNRILHADILTSRQVDAIAGNPPTEVFYRRLLSVVDDYGRYSANPTLLRSACYPRRVDAITDAIIQGFLVDMERAKLIKLYEIDSEPYLEIDNFRQQLRIKRSKFPEPQPHITRIADAAHLMAERQSPALQMRPEVNSEYEANSESDVESPPPIHSTADSNSDHTSHPSVACVAPATHVTSEPVQLNVVSINRNGFAPATRQTDRAPLDAFFEERYSKHPKKGDRGIAQTYMVEIPGIGTPAGQAEFAAGHDAWISSEEWVWKCGARAPTFAKFILDKTWKYLPARTVIEETPVARAARLTIERLKEKEKTA